MGAPPGPTTQDLGPAASDLILPCPGPRALPPQPRGPPRTVWHVCQRLMRGWRLIDPEAPDSCPRPRGPRAEVACFWAAFGCEEPLPQLVGWGLLPWVPAGLGQTGDSLSLLCDRRRGPRQPRRPCQHHHRRGPCGLLGPWAGPWGPKWMDRRPEVTGQQAPSFRPPWPEPCVRRPRQARGQPAPRHLCLRPSAALPLPADLRPLLTEPGRAAHLDPRVEAQ